MQIAKNEMKTNCEMCACVCHWNRLEEIWVLLNAFLSIFKYFVDGRRKTSASLTLSIYFIKHFTVSMLIARFNATIFTYVWTIFRRRCHPNFYEPSQRAKPKILAMNGNDWMEKMEVYKLCLCVACDGRKCFCLRYATQIQPSPVNLMRRINETRAKHQQHTCAHCEWQTKGEQMNAEMRYLKL